MKAGWLCLLLLSLFVLVLETQAVKKTKENVKDVSKHRVKGTDHNHDYDDDDDDDDDEAPNETIDETIVNAANDTLEFDYMYSPNAFDPKKSLIKIEYDMIFTAEQLEQRNGTSSRKRAAGIRDGSEGGYRWTRNHIPYQFARGVFYGRQINTIKAAMRDWARYTCLTFSEAHRGNRMYFRNGGGCSSAVGMHGGAQAVTLAPTCRYRHVVTHEIGHAIGLHHEQTRPDRDRYVRIHNRNIPYGVQFNFKRHSWSVIQDFGIPYDYTSIMHYGGTAFSFNRRLTIQTTDPSYQNVIGNRRRLSFRDIKTVNFMYKCREANRCRLKHSDCPGEGFVGKDCKCWCPGDPYVHCSPKGGKTGGKTKGKTGSKTKGKTGSKTKGKTGSKSKGKTGSKSKGKTGGKTTKKACFDSLRKCSYWARYSQCQINPTFMNYYCKKSCKVCKVKTPTSKKKVGCRDLHYSCPSWAAFGYCNSFAYKNYMYNVCRKSCGLCSSNNNNNRGGTTKANCQDYNWNCPTMAAYGHCQTNWFYMKSNCPKSCRLCAGSRNSHRSPGSKTRCVDNHSLCQSWARLGSCRSNPAYMLVFCKKSCQVKGC